MSDVTEVWNTNGKARFVGKISNQGFVVRIKRHRKEGFRPRIHGVYDFQEGNKTMLALSIEMDKRPVVLFSVMIGFWMLMGIIKKSFFVIPSTLCMIIIMYFVGWVFYQIDLPTTKKEMVRLIEEAKS